MFSLSSGCTKRWIDPARPRSVKDKESSKASISQVTTEIATGQSLPEATAIEVTEEVATSQKNTEVDISRMVPMKPPLLRNYSSHVVTRW